MRGMRHAVAVLTLCGSLAAGAALADQNDPRLNGLFERLQAAEDLEQARRLEQQIWRIWHHSDDVFVSRTMERGIRAMARRDLERALDQFNLVVSWAPDFAEGWNRRATVHYLMGDYEASVRDIQRALALEPRHFGALSGLGLIYHGLHQPEPALRSFEAALEINPHLEGTQERIEELRQAIQGRAT